MPKLIFGDTEGKKRAALDGRADRERERHIRGAMSAIRHIMTLVSEAPQVARRQLGELVARKCQQAGCGKVPWEHVDEECGPLAYLWDIRLRYQGEQYLSEAMRRIIKDALEGQNGK